MVRQAYDYSCGVAALTTLLSNNSVVTAEATQADGGNILVGARHMLRLRDSTLTATVGGGAETVGGNIALDPEFVLLENGKIVAQAKEDRGENIRLEAEVFLADPASMVSASSARGINGAVDIRAPVADLSGSLVPLPYNFGKATVLLPQRCAERLRAGQENALPKTAALHEVIRVDAHGTSFLHGRTPPAFSQAVLTPDCTGLQPYLFTSPNAQ